MTAEQVVRGFFQEVRSGQAPDNAHLYMAPLVLAHQMNSENPVTVRRTPQEYADHVREMQAAYGTFQLEIEELIAGEDKVYVRWKQTGKHVGPAEGFAASGKEVIELASAVYRIDHNRIVEYWIQIDRHGILEQMKKNSETLI